MEVVVGPIDLGGDPTHHPAVAASQKILGLRMGEVGVQPPVQEHVALQLERPDPRRARGEAHGEVASGLGGEAPLVAGSVSHDDRGSGDAGLVLVNRTASDRDIGGLP